MGQTKWFRDAIVYHILIDRFAGYDPLADWQKPVFTGGNLKAIISKIPYLNDLGINTIWISPLNKTSAYHGYHVTDFYSVDEHFGTVHDLKDLIAAAHKENIRIILDFVPNHCSRKHPLFIEAYRNKKSRYRKWFYFNRFNNKYNCFLDILELPKINLDNKEARDHIIEAAKYWVSTGIDGFRLDHAIGPSHRFWRIFNQATKSSNPEVVLIGEAWLEGVSFSMLKTIRIKRKYLRYLLRLNPWDIQREYIGEFDGVLDFYFRHRITEYIARNDNPQSGVHIADSLMKKHYQRFPNNYYLPSFIDNHDMNRFLYDAGQDKQKLKLALNLQFALPQPPILYYGTETGLTNHYPVQMNIPYSDIQARQHMPWNALDQNLINYCKDLIIRRKKI
jgi:cyclomaltodextrinase